MTLPIEEIEKKVYERTKDIRFVSHGFDHLKRTAIGAKWFAQLFGGSERQQNIAYIAGLVHDFERPRSEKIEHKDISAEEARKFLEQFRFAAEIIEQIIRMVEEHRYVSNLPPINQTLFLSDKILEQSGAFIIFRRCVYAGECIDFEGKPFFESITAHWKARMARFRPQVYNQKVSRLANYQYDWQLRFFKAFENSEDWAVDIAKQCYEEGKKQKKSIVQIVEDIEVSNDGKDFKEEALLYINGKKFKRFEEMIAE